MSLTSVEAHQKVGGFALKRRQTHVHQLTALLIAATFLSGCKVSREPEPAPTAQVIEFESQAKKAASRAEQHAHKIMADTKKQVPIPEGPNTILFTADMNDLDRQIMEGK